MLIDLSYQIDNTIISHPYDTQPKLYQDKTLSRDKFNNFRVELGMHCGTHIDSPMHLTSSNKYINQYDLQTFMGRAVLIQDRSGVVCHKEKYDLLIEENDIVIVSTGHEFEYGKETYYREHPILDREFAQKLVSKKIKMIGFDLPSPDTYPFDIHKLFFAHDILIIENLRNLMMIHKEVFRIYAFPINICADSGIARVVAEVPDA